jgi:hypothetical protein
MELTIPVFRALAAADAVDEFHTTHGQLGFALKDQRVPDWAGAESELTKAITIRGSWQEKGWIFYEFNRAICRIELDPAFKQDKATPKPQGDAILADLRVAWSSPEVRRIIRDEELVQRWLTLNGLSPGDLDGA